MTTDTLDAAAPAPAPEVIESFTVTLIIRRFNPEADEQPKWVDYDVEMYATDRILDALHKIKWEQDGSLTFRRSCAHGICGSDAMRINGRNRLACKTLIKDLDISKPIYVEAIKGLPLEKDLIVDMDPFFESFRDVQPFLMPSSKPGRRQGADPVRRRPRAVRRHDEVHSLRGMHVVLSRVLDRWPVLRACGHRQRPPLHLRLARRCSEGAPRHPQRQRGCVALPHHVQLHRCLPTRHPGHAGDRRGQAGHHARQAVGLLRSVENPSPSVEWGVFRVTSGLVGGGGSPRDRVGRRVTRATEWAAGPRAAEWAQRVTRATEWAEWVTRGAQ